MQRLFVWDYHGTLCTGAEDALKTILDNVLESFGINKKVSNEDVLGLFGKPLGDFFRHFQPTIGHAQLVEMTNFFEKLSKEVAPLHIKPRENVHAVLGEIRKRGDVNVVVSSTPPHRLLDFLEMISIQDLIDHYIGIPYIIEHKGGKAVAYKARKVKEFAAGRFSSVVMTGDRETDMEIGRRLGAKTFFLSDKPYVNADKIISGLSEVLEVYKENPVDSLVPEYHE